MKPPDPGELLLCLQLLRKARATIEAFPDPYWLNAIEQLKAVDGFLVSLGLPATPAAPEQEDFL